MTKMIKMSLIAAVAVTGITSVATAQPLEEAIKGVDVSGMLRYRYDDTKSNLTNGASTQSNEYTMKIATVSKVNDIVTANVQVEARGVTAISDSQAHATSDATGDRDVTLAVTKANFAANLGFATVIAGKQSVPTPMVDNHSDDTTRGTGAVALVPAGPVTIAAGYFNNIQVAQDTNPETLANTSLYVGKNTSAVGILGKVADVSFDAWMAEIADTRSGVSIGANLTVSGVNVDARHTSLDQDSATAKDADLTKIIASTKIGAVSVVAGLATTSKVSASQTVAGTGVSLDGDNDAKSDLRLWQASVGALSDATAFLIGAGMDVMPGLNLDAKYVTVDYGTGSQAASELLVGLTYKMSKNFSVHTRYSMYDVDAANGSKAIDSDKGRLELKYTF